MVLSRSCFWAHKHNDNGHENGVQSIGIVVTCAWISSERRHLLKYVHLYASFGWDSLVVQPTFLDMFFPRIALGLASVVLDKLSKEIERRPRPVVFASFSGGATACMIKVFQVLEENLTEANPNSEKYKLIRKCVVGQIYDSCPADFVSEVGEKFAISPTILKWNHVPRVWKWGAHGVARVLDALFLERNERLRAEYWQAMYSLVYMGPILILCSENDEISSYETIRNFASRLKKLGGCVRVVSWKDSAHVGHYILHPEEYRDAVAALFDQAFSFYQISGSSNTEKSVERVLTQSPCHGLLSHTFQQKDAIATMETNYYPDMYKKLLMKNHSLCKRTMAQAIIDHLVEMDTPENPETSDVELCNTSIHRQDQCVKYHVGQALCNILRLKSHSRL